LKTASRFRTERKRFSLSKKNKSKLNKLDNRVEEKERIPISSEQKRIDFENALFQTAKRDCTIHQKGQTNSKKAKSRAKDKKTAKIAKHSQPM